MMAEQPLGAPPGPSKIVAVHLSYRSRAMERGTLPPWPSYFLKPPNTLAADGAPVLRPPGCELLAFEGEIALIIGRRATRVAPRDAWQHVGWVTAANDFGVYDLRYADKGANMRSKGVDGFTPLGPELLSARAVDPERVRLRAWVNGELLQDAVSGDDLLFSFADIVADISRLTTLEPGDVILTGTPAGSTVVAPGDLVEVEVIAGDLTTGRLRSPVAEADYELSSPGALPAADDTQRAAALGARLFSAERDADDSPGALLTAIGAVSTATLASQLKKRGYDSVTLDRLRTTRPEARMAGFARTVRYVPLREDLFKVHGGGFNAQKQAVEQIRHGEILVIDARGDATAGTIGDILALRAQVRGAKGIVTDGAIRDSEALKTLAIPVYYSATHPAVLGRRHVPWETNVTVACAGVTIRPGDIIAGDADGVIVVPLDVAAEVARDAAEQERQELFIAERVAAGESVDGLYPLGPK
jgi:regulator of RNase E activity RraA/2-keto-4-pentenoate hydratase/2-oxohepta-3-ene-1,7-dioic acid hydratase in catechol pathway